MSHIETCSVVITDLKALKTACEKLGAVFKENQTTFKRWANASYAGAGVSQEDINSVEHAIGVPGVDAEVGLALIKNSKAKMKSYKLLKDFYSQGAGLQKKFCKQHANGTYSSDMEVLNQAYSIEVLKAKARAKGYTWQEKTVNGVTKLVVTLGN